MFSLLTVLKVVTVILFFLYSIMKTPFTMSGGITSLFHMSLIILNSPYRAVGEYIFVCLHALLSLRLFKQAVYMKPLHNGTECVQISTPRHMTTY